MKHYTTLIFLLFSLSLSAQFRMVSNGLPSWTVLTDSTYSATINLFSDLTGGSFNGTQVDNTMRMFTDRATIYTVDSVLSVALSQVVIRVKEYGSTNGTPAGQLMIYDPNGQTAVPQVPFGNTGATAKLQAAVDSYNSSVIGSGDVASVNGQTGVVVLDPDDLDDSATTNKFTTASDISKLAGIEAGATADQSDAEIETAYNNQVPVVSQITAEAGISTTVERWTPQRVAQAIAALGGTAGDSTLWANVRSYGAAGDGSDATTAFTNAIATGKTVYVPDGRYLIADTLRLLPDQTIFGNGDKSILKTTANTWIIRATTRNNINNLRFVGDGISGGDTAQRGIFIDGEASFTQAYENTISNCNFDSLGGAGIYITRTVQAYQGNLISSCYAKRCLVGFQLATRGEYTQISNSIAVSCTTGFRITAGNANLSGCSASSNTTGILVESGDNDAHGFADGCQFNHNTTNIHVNNPTKEFLFSSCMSYQGNVILNSCDNIQFLGCYFSGGSITETSVTNTYFLSCDFVPTVTRTPGGAYYINNIRTGGLTETGSFPTSNGDYVLRVASGVHSYEATTGGTESTTAFSLDGTDTLTVSITNKIFRVNVLENSITKDTLTLTGDVSGRYTLHAIGITDSLIIDFQPDVLGPSGGVMDTAVIYFDGFYDFYFDGSDYYVNILGNQGSTPTGFDPDDPSLFLAWVDASDSGNRTVNGSNEITQLSDKSGNGNHYTGTTGSTPTLSAAAHNSLDVADFDGTEWLADASSQATYNALHNGAKRTIFIIAKAGNTASPEYNGCMIGNNSIDGGRVGVAVAAYDAAANEDRCLVKIATGTTDASQEFQDNTLPSNLYKLIIVEVDADNATTGDRIELYINSGADIAAPSGSTTPSSSDASYTMQIGASGDNDKPFIGQIGEIRISSRELTLTERNAIRDFLIAKWSPE